MIFEAFAYAIAVTFLVGLAAVSVEQLFAELGRPRRLAWLGGYAVAVVFPLVSMLGAAAPALDAALATSAAFDAPPLHWDTLLVRLWVATTALLLLAYVGAWIRLSIIAKRWQRVVNDNTPLALSDDIGPAVLGVFRPRIVLPRWLASAPESIRSTVLAHELEHIAARDQVFILAAQIITVLLPWNLPLWWFTRRLRTAIEVDCDARVLRRGIDAGHYADVLLAVGQRRSRLPFLAATLIEPVTQLERRIRIMLTRRTSGAALRATAAAAAALAIAACVTRIEPPPLMTNPPPSALTVGSPTQIEASEIRQSPDRQLVTLTAPKLMFRAGTSDEARLTAERLSVNETDETFLLEGNVRIDYANTSITAARALGRKTANGSIAWTIYDAVIAPLGPDAANLSE
jgi:bla regulator protein BlaR1